jgi:mevalonyl-CoA ligase
MAHPTVSTAVVVGLQSKRYGEAVAAFLRASEGQPPGDDEVRQWVRRKLGAHKAPEHIFWLGQGDVPAEVPLTGSGKVKKFQMAELGNRLLKEGTVAKL